MGRRDLTLLCGTQNNTMEEKENYDYYYCCYYYFYYQFFKLGNTKPAENVCELFEQHNIVAMSSHRFQCGPPVSKLEHQRDFICRAKN